MLVYHDMLGLFEGIQPRFVKRFAELGREAAEAIRRYCEEVRAGSFPGPEHVYEDDEGKSPDDRKSSSPPAEHGSDRGGGYLTARADEPEG